MKPILKILQFSYPYYSLIILNTLFNFLAVLFSLFSISLIIPILGLLFNTIELPENSVTEFSINQAKEFFYSYIDSVLKNHGESAALAFICMFVGIGTILKNIFRYLALYCLTPIRNNVIRDIRYKLHFKLLNLPIHYINKFKKGDLVAKMTNDLTEIEWSIMGVLEFFIKDPIHIVIFLISLIYISPELTLMSVVFVPITAFLITKVSTSLKKTSLLSQNKMGELISIITESISHIKIIKVFNAQNFISKNFETNNNDLKNTNNKVLWRKDLASPMSEMLSTLVLVIIIWFGGKIVLNEEIDADSFIGFLVIFSQILPPTKSLTSAFYSIQKGSAAAIRVLQILDFKNINTDKKLSEIQKLNHNITFKNVEFKYDKERVLKNINLKIAKGEKIAIVGESGAGKSTLIELLLKFYNSSNGAIFIDDNNIEKYNYKQLFSLTTQDTLLFNDTIINNLLVSNPHASREDIQQATKKAHIHSIIKKLDQGYDTIIGPKGTNLSVGEKQRLGIARALLSNTPILIFDEPTSSLDAESSNYIQNAFNELDKSKTLIIITHKLHTIKKYKRIIVMKNGEIVEEGNHDFLLNKNGAYKKLYQIESLKVNEKN